MKSLKHLFDNNRAWVKEMQKLKPGFFELLSKQQAPEYLWIGCSDSRVLANEIVNLLPGELFVHRNVANLVVHTDLNCLSVIQYAVDVLKVKHIIVCGHYGCGGVRAAVEKAELGLIDNWLRHLGDVCERNRSKIDSQPSIKEKVNLLCELSIFEQVKNLALTTIVQGAWARGQKLEIHGWVYDLEDGLLRDILGFVVDNKEKISNLNT
ncbi:MAG: carbonate dehydratase [Elusimicrobiota bacterium]